MPLVFINVIPSPSMYEPPAVYIRFVYTRFIDVISHLQDDHFTRSVVARHGAIELQAINGSSSSADPRQNEHRELSNAILHYTSAAT